MIRVSKTAARRYGLSDDAVANMLESQGHRCAICRKSRPQLVIDHCHDTGEPRGLICNLCNVFLANVERGGEPLGALLRYVDMCGEIRRTYPPLPADRKPPSWAERVAAAVEIVRPLLEGRDAPVNEGDFQLLTGSKAREMIAAASELGWVLRSGPGDRELVPPSHVFGCVPCSSGCGRQVPKYNPKRNYCRECKAERNRLSDSRRRSCSECGAPCRAPLRTCSQACFRKSLGDWKPPEETNYA